MVNGRRQSGGLADGTAFPGTKQDQLLWARRDLAMKRSERKRERSAVFPRHTSASLFSRLRQTNRWSPKDPLCDRRARRTQALAPASEDAVPPACPQYETCFD